MKKVESAYLNADQEQKVMNLLAYAENILGHTLSPWGAFVPKGYETIRVLIEASTARNALEARIKDIEAGTVDLEGAKNAIKQFDKVLAHELAQIQAKTQKFVPEQNEATQE